MEVSIDWGSIQSKLIAWENSARGQRKIQNKISEYIRNDVQITQAGSKVLTNAKMTEIANHFAEYLRSAAAGVPGSIMTAIGSISCGAVTANPDGSFFVELSFSGDLTGPSLYPEKHGVAHNMVAIFNNGYSASGPVYGDWHGVRVKSRVNREGLHFMQAAAAKFTAEYGPIYNISVSVGDDYT